MRRRVGVLRHQAGFRRDLPRLLDQPAKDAELAGAIGHDFLEAPVLANRRALGVPAHAVRHPQRVGVLARESPRRGRLFGAHRDDADDPRHPLILVATCRLRLAAASGRLRVAPDDVAFPPRAQRQHAGDQLDQRQRARDGRLVDGDGPGRPAHRGIVREAEDADPRRRAVRLVGDPRGFEPPENRARQLRRGSKPVRRQQQVDPRMAIAAVGGAARQPDLRQDRRILREPPSVRHLEDQIAKPITFDTHQESPRRNRGDSRTEMGKAGSRKGPQGPQGSHGPQGSWKVLAPVFFSLVDFL
jgi:hypothetical protein